MPVVRVTVTPLTGTPDVAENDGRRVKLHRRERHRAAADAPPPAYVDETSHEAARAAHDRSPSPRVVPASIVPPERAFTLS